MFISRLSELVYYLDGQYLKMLCEINNACKFPAVFTKKFSGFNCPEKSKHRKRELNDLSEKKLEKHCTVIREIMQSPSFHG